MAGDDATLEVIIKASNETKLAFAEISAQLDALAVQMVAIKAATAAAGFGFVSFFQGLVGPGGVPVVGILIGALITLGVVLAPIIAELIAFSLGVTAMATILTVAVGALALVAAGFFGLGIAAVGIMDKLDKKKNKTAEEVAMLNQLKIVLAPLVDAYDKLGLAIQRMVVFLAVAAIPQITFMVRWLLDLLPIVQRLGLELLNWFGARLPAMFSLFNGIIWATVGAFRLLGTGIGQVVDYVLARQPQFLNFFNQVMVISATTITETLKYLMRLTDWFLVRAPAMVPVVVGTMQVIGSIILGIGTIAGKVVDWFIANWPSIQKVAQTVAGSLVAGFNWITQNGEVLRQIFGANALMIEEIRKRADNAKPLLVVLGAAFGAVAGMVGLFTASLLAAVNMALMLIGVIQQLISWISKIPSIPALNMGSGTTGHGRGSKHGGGEITSTGLYMLQTGERVLPPGGGSGGGGGGSYVFNFDFRNAYVGTKQELTDMVSREMAKRLSMHAAINR